MKYCTACGAELQDNAKFCTKCGAQVPQSITPEITPVKKKNNHVIIAVVAVIVVIIAAVAIRNGSGGGKAYEKPVYNMVEALNEHSVKKMIKTLPINEALGAIVSASSENLADQLFDVFGDHKLEVSVNSTYHMDAGDLESLAESDWAKAFGSNEDITDGYKLVCEVTYDEYSTEMITFKVGKWKGKWYVYSVS